MNVYLYFPIYELHFSSDRILNEIIARIVLYVMFLAHFVFSAELQIVGRVLRKIPAQFGHARIEDHPDYLLEALQEALSLVGPVKGYPTLPSL